MCKPNETRTVQSVRKVQMGSSKKVSVNGASTHTNVLIKTSLPACGVVSSNPKRIERLLEHGDMEGFLQDIKEHTNAGWGVTIYTANYKGTAIFVAAVPMGAAGSGFAFFEMFAAGAKAIIRYGSNDRQVTIDDAEDVIIVNQADNLISLPHAIGMAHVTTTDVLEASSQLIELVEAKSKEMNLFARKMICHNVEDYHAYNFPHFFENDDKIRDNIFALEEDGPNREDCWDMETASLFWRAKQFGAHAATVLQNLCKTPGTSPYEGEHGKISLGMEHTFFTLILEALHEFYKSTSFDSEQQHLMQSKYNTD